MSETESQNGAAAVEAAVKAEVAPKEGGDAPAAAEEKKVAVKSEGNGDVKESKPNVARIIRQVEHYFGDYNLPRDRFLLEKIKEDDGWVPMEVMLKFQRLSAMSTDPAVILAALKTSTSGLMEVDEEGQRIRRSPDRPVQEITDERKEEVQRCTVYCKGFDKENTTLDEVLEFFDDYNVVNVHLRFFHDKKKGTKGFKGSVFVVFKDREAAEKFLALDKVVYKGAELTDRKWQADYNQEKKDEFESRKKKFTDEKKKVKEAKQAAEKAAAEEEEDAAGEEEGLPKGSVLHMKGLNGETMREDIKAELLKLYEVSGNDIAFIYFNKGDSEAKLRFKKENAAVELCKQIPESGFQIKGDWVTSSVLEGDEEDAFLKKCLEEMKAWKRKTGGGKGHKRKGGFRGGRGGKRQRV